MIYAHHPNYILSDKQLKNLDKLDFLNFNPKKELYNVKYTIRVESVYCLCDILNELEIKLMIYPNVSSQIEKINIITRIYKKLITIPKYFNCNLNIKFDLCYKDIIGEIIIRTMKDNNNG